MSDLPSPEWTVDDYLRWMQEPFDYLREEWALLKEDKRSWEDCKPRFLELLGTDVSQLESETVPQLRVLRLFISHIDEGLTDDVERQDILVAETARTEVVRACVETCQRELAEQQAAVPPPPPPELAPGTPESFTWVTWRQKEQLKVLGDAWPERVRENLDREYPGWTQTTVDNLVTHLDNWMDIILAGVASPDPAPLSSPATDLSSWVTPDQQEQFSPDWEGFLRRQLDTYYEGWETATHDGLRTWLRDWTPTLLATRATDKPQPAAEADDRVETESTPAEQVPAQAAKELLTTVTAKVRGEVKIPDSVTEEELEDIVIEVMRERIAARAGR